jgi:hypothetical protein
MDTKANSMHRQAYSQCHVRCWRLPQSDMWRRVATALATTVYRTQSCLENGGNRVVMVDLKYGKKTARKSAGFEKSDCFD